MKKTLNFNLIADYPVSHCAKLSKAEQEELFHIWNNQYPDNFKYSEISELEKYLEGLQSPEHILLKNKEGNVIAWLGLFLRNSEYWFAIIIANKYQAKGIGTDLISLAQSKHSSLKAWIIDRDDLMTSQGDLYRNPKNFYLKCQFDLEPIFLESNGVQMRQISWNKKP